MIADQYETEEDTVWAPVMGEARGVKQSYAWRLRLPVCIVLGMAAAVFLVVGCGNMVGNGSWSCNKLGLERRCAKAQENCADFGCCADVGVLGSVYVHMRPSNRVKTRPPKRQLELRSNWNSLYSLSLLPYG